MTIQEKIETGPGPGPMVEDPAFTPIRVGGFEVKNRLVMSSVTSGLGDHTGAATERNAAFLERRARDISKTLRCLGCQNQSIDDSNADLARDLRILVRERLVAGDDDAVVIDFIVARYGDYVLLNPPFKGSTYVLWIGPGVIFAFGAVAVVPCLRRRRSEAPPPLTEAEARRVEARMDDGPRCARPGRPCPR